MNNICVIYDEDITYAKKLMNIFSHNKNVPFSIQMFTEISELIQYLLQNESVLLIVSERSVQIDVIKNHSGPIMVLVEEESDIKLKFKNEGMNNAIGIYKYQSGENILNEVIRESGCDFCKRTKDVKVIGIFTPAIVNARTKFSLDFLRCINEQKKTLYINLEEFAGLTKILPSYNHMNLSDALYFYRQNGEVVNEKICEAICEVNKVAYIPPIQCAKDIEMLTSNQILKFAGDIAKFSGYECVVLDIAYAVKQQSVIISGCDVVYMPVAGDYLSLKKIEDFETYFLSLGYESILNKIIKVNIPLDSDIADNYLEKTEYDSMYNCVRRLIHAKDNT